MIWDVQKTNLLIEKYREKRILWDLRNPNYKDNRKKLKSWEEIALKFECSVKEAKDKVKNLRTTFHRYRKKKSGSAQSDQWVHFSSLSFLLEVDVPRLGLSTDNDINSENGGMEKQDVDLNDREMQSDEAQRTPAISIDESVPSRAQPTPRIADGEYIIPFSKGKKLRRLGIDRDEEDRRADEVYDIIKITSQRDDFAIYGEHVGNELRKLSWIAQTIAKHHINNILFDAAMGKFDAPPPAHTFSSSSYSSQSSPRPTPGPTLIPPATPPMLHCTSPMPSYPGHHEASAISSRKLDKTTEFSPDSEIHLI